MRKLLLAILITLAGWNIMAQTTGDQTEGTISYVTSQSVYVKFTNTEGIEPGDTLFMNIDGQTKPALRVNNVSSISAVCAPLLQRTFKTDEKVVANLKLLPLPVIEPTETEPQEVVIEGPDSLVSAETEEEKLFEENIRGRIRVASYSNFSNTDAPFNQRMRYTFSLNANHINDSRVSVESYLSFIHSNLRWNEIQDDIFNGLKIYNLAVTYDFNQSTRAVFGRKINPRMSNIGAIDGLQFEKKFGNFSAGAIAGSRPDYINYGYNFDLLQYGVYFGHDQSGNNGRTQSTVSFMEQTNKGNTDRRFLYFQHSNALVKNVYFFGSAEMDLYKKVDGQATSTFDLTNLYLMLRYRPVRQLSLTASYSARNNIVYYETFKSFIDRLLETETLQGWRFQINYRPIKYLALGVSGGYRFRKTDPNPSRNLYAYASYTRLPGINASVTASVTILETGYLSGRIYSLRLNRDIIPGKLFGGISYRLVDYQYINYEIAIDQHMADVNLTWKILKKLSMGMNWEGTFESPRTFNRLYANLNYRF
ncbi:MAG: hypothetical protein KQI35_01350 [Bacteroidetes bacterium]|nr:hypothetical protein [Bacteroidota bacterium]